MCLEEHLEHSKLYRSACCCCYYHHQQQHHHPILRQLWGEEYANRGNSLCKDLKLHGMFGQRQRVWCGCNTDCGWRKTLDRFAGGRP